MIYNCNHEFFYFFFKFFFHSFSDGEYGNNINFFICCAFHVYSINNGLKET